MNRKFDFPEDATPLHDYSDLIPEWILNLTDLNRAEVANISQAQRKYLKNIKDPVFWFRPLELYSIHHAMFCDVWKWAGKTRTSITSIGVNPPLISVRLAELCHEVNAWSKEPVELTFLERAARIHHRLVYIHPFENGNGRFARLIADRYLIFWKCAYSIWPSNLYREGKSRSFYIEALKEADRGNYDSLIQFMHEHKARDPSLNKFQTSSYYKKQMTKEQRIACLKALFRRA